MSDWTALLWLGMVVLFVIIEALTAQMICIWFVIGAVAALIFSFFGVNIWWQLGIFLTVSALTIIFTRQIVKKMLVKNPIPTNADRLVGTCGVVTEEICNELGVGAVNVSGQIWSARATDKSVIPVGTSVQIQSIQGVKLMVLPVGIPEK